MTRILTGIQSSGQPHLGNLLGAMEPAIELSKKADNEAFFFIADLHSLTTIKDGDQRRELTKGIAAAWVACGLDTDRHTFYRQSRIPEVTELAWYLECFTPYPMLANVHTFKAKAEKLSDVNAGLFVYPVLQTADIVGYDADVVPVGKDQEQHLEMARDIAAGFNRKYGDIFVVPASQISEEVKLVPGTDGQKMSKSYGNTLDIFASEKVLKKQIGKIVTDSKGLDEPKDPDTCNVVTIFRLVATKEQVDEMETNYRAGGYGYGHAKKALLEVLLEKYAEPRRIYGELMADPDQLETILLAGEEKARVVIREVLEKVRTALGFS